MQLVAFTEWCEKTGFREVWPTTRDGGGGPLDKSINK